MTTERPPTRIPQPAPYPAVRPLRRRQRSVLGGVAGGVADHLGVDATKVRVVFALLAVLGGAGIVAYALLWIFMRPSAQGGTTSSAERRRATGLIVLGVAGAFASSWLLSGSAASVIVPIVVVGIGAALVWREFDADGPRSIIGMPRHPTALTWARVVAGVSLVVVGLGVVVLAQVDLASLRSSLLAVVVTLVGVGLLSVPIWLRMVRTLNEERAARIRDAEREEIASHLHDSVLQTLALIQKQPGDPQQVLRLARSQERELRQWLFGGTRTAQDSLIEALRAACAEVEDHYGVTIDPVFVGEIDAASRSADDGARPSCQALVAAAREALVNAAKHSGAQRVDLYAEGQAPPEAAANDERMRVSVFVRDRGVGFDPDAIPADRKGVTGSIRARIARHGGAAEIRSGSERGTEVRLTMPFAVPRAAENRIGDEGAVSG
ncbi:PspC domain-containing protein [Tomitella cavernea]|uniref:ATP-binding protein n=1 Tax=Tomitella cavernea TaxID=1387982 RepID=A0ABP9CC13_9ACTN